jgi:PBP1b-binding outer membrane lipoprotein LpoB
MRTSSLAAAIVAGALLAGCSKPEPAAGGAPSPNVVTSDSTKPTDSTAKPTDTTAAAVMPDSMNAVKDTAAPATPDTAKKN